MVLKISDQQFAQFDALAARSFFEDMRETLYEHHGSVQNKDQLFAACRHSCQDLGIETEAALFAYFDMSFALGVPLATQPDYAEPVSYTHLTLPTIYSV